LLVRRARLAPVLRLEDVLFMEEDWLEAWWEEDGPGSSDGADSSTAKSFVGKTAVLRLFEFWQWPSGT
jgi:hypothetical protein